MKNRIEEIRKQKGITQEDFAKRMDTTPKNLSLLVRGEQSLSIDVAMKLSRMLGTSVDYWLNLQRAYDSLIAQCKSEEELKREREIVKYLDYNYFIKNFELEDLTGKRDEQIQRVREFMKVATLSVLAKKGMSVEFLGDENELSEAEIIKANSMVQIAINKALEIEAPRFNKKKFEKAVQNISVIRENKSETYTSLYNELFSAGVILVVLPGIPGTKTEGATKKLGNNVVLMVNDKNLCMDRFWCVLFHEIKHIMDGKYGISFENMGK